MREQVVLYCDGGMLGPKNPSPEGVMWSVYADPPGAVMERGESREHHTNNEAEYLALKAALEYARRNHPSARLTVRMDSLFVVNTYNGTWRLNGLPLRRLRQQCREVADRAITLEWQPRRELVKRVGH